MNLRYFANYVFPRGWAVGTSPNMLVNYASDGSKVTFPIGLSISRVQKIGVLPVKFQLQGQYMAGYIHQYLSRDGSIQVAITPVIPN